MIHLVHLLAISISPTGQVTGTGLYSGSPGDLFKTVANTLLIIIGLISVLMTIIGGLRYALSAGDPSATKGAKDTILFAVIGVVVALVAGSIVNFVVGKF